MDIPVTKMFDKNKQPCVVNTCDVERWTKAGYTLTLPTAPVTPPPQAVLPAKDKTTK